MKIIDSLKKYKKIIVTGPQRSGTRLGAKCISNDLGYKYIDEGEIQTSNVEELKKVLKEDNIVIHCPAISHICHTLGDDVAVVFMIRDKKEIEESMDKIGWKKNNLQKELDKYKAKGNIIDIKYNYWNKFQKDKCNAFELKYEDLKKHGLFIPKEEREELKKEGKWSWKSTNYPKRINKCNCNTVEYWNNEYINLETKRFKKRAYHDRGKKIDIIIAELKNGDTVLDVGTGAGGCLRQYFKKKDIKVTACDFSPKAVAYLKKTFNIPVVQGDLNKRLPFKDNSFDIVICTETLEHTNDPVKSKQELKRIARKKVIITVPYKEDPISNPVSPEHLWSFSEKDFEGKTYHFPPFVVEIINITN